MNELYHHGILGQKWGVRRYQNEDGSLTEAGKSRYMSPRAAKRYAKKDAKEYARAKMFYGEGAGNRRKLIKATVNERSKDPEYKRRFDEYLQKQDMAKHATKAQSERHRKDVTKSVGKTARGWYHLSMGDTAKVAAGAAFTYALLHKTGTDKKIAEFAKNKLGDIKDSVKTVRAREKLKREFKGVR